MNFLFWFIGFCVHVSCATVPVKRQTPQQPSGRQNDFVRQGMIGTNAEYDIKPEKGVRKRAINAATKGLVAVEKLLMGSRKATTSSKNYRLYRKHGNVNTAIQDFHSVEPRIITNKKTNKRKPSNVFRTSRRTDDVIMGTVGDRRLILLLQGDRASKYNPVLEIRSPTDSLHDRIVYRKYY